MKLSSAILARADTLLTHPDISIEFDSRSRQYSILLRGNEICRGVDLIQLADEAWAVWKADCATRGVAMPKTHAERQAEASAAAAARNAAADELQKKMSHYQHELEKQNFERELEEQKKRAAIAKAEIIRDDWQYRPSRLKF